MRTILMLHLCDWAKLARYALQVSSLGHIAGENISFVTCMLLDIGNNTYIFENNITMQFCYVFVSL